MDNRFSEIIDLIRHARNRAIRAVNAELINLYCCIGAQISHKIKSAEWGSGVVKELAAHIRRNEPLAKGFSDKNLWRMKQFVEVYQDDPNSHRW
jgi:hypothetical protein